jgi:hypothetical protein
MNGFVLRYFLVEFIRIADRAVFRTDRAARAFAFDDVPGLLDQGYRKFAGLAFDAVNLG